MSADKKNLLLLFDRPLEPVVTPKGKNNTKFDVPKRLLTKRFQESPEISDRLGSDSDDVIPVKANITIPNLKRAEELDRKAQFSLLIPYHRELAKFLITVFMGLRNVDDLQTVAVYARDRINPLLFNYALSVAILHRTDTKGLNLPLLFETFPDKFVDSKVMSRAREEANIALEEQRDPIIIPKDFTASDLDPEHRLWYFREDIGVNLHHWHWHLVYPFAGPDRVIRKDRRGELFYYMHSQLVSRYNFERFSNDLPRVKRLNNFREPIPEAYFPKMDSLVSSRAWPARTANMVMGDISRDLDQIKYDVTDLERWEARFIQAIHQGWVEHKDGRRITLDAVKGIDILGDMFESSDLSINGDLYGDLHNMLHLFIALIHDPDGRYLENFSTMGDFATAMRDPIFYRVHAYVDDLFQEHKQRLPKGPTNTFQTYWQQSDIDLSRGLDFAPRGNVFARYTHLQHTDFSYTFNIFNSTGALATGTARIFLAPRNDERGTPMFLRDQRLLMIELDKFSVALIPGNNVIQRQSTDSNVTIPFEQTFRDLETDRPGAGTTEEEEFNFCGCGWPQHMLIPKGKPGNGLPCVLFVMISNGDDDRVNQSLVGACNDAAVYCGVRDRLYPDLKAMGYPFDRLPRQGGERLDQFLTANMRTISCSIVHTDAVKVIRKGAPSAQFDQRSGRRH